MFVKVKPLIYCQANIEMKLRVLYGKTSERSSGENVKKKKTRVALKQSKLPTLLLFLPYLCLFFNMCALVS